MRWLARRLDCISVGRYNAHWEVQIDKRVCGISHGFSDMQLRDLGRGLQFGTL